MSHVPSLALDLDTLESVIDKRQGGNLQTDDLPDYWYQKRLKLSLNIAGAMTGARPGGGARAASRPVHVARRVAHNARTTSPSAGHARPATAPRSWPTRVPLVPSVLR